MDPFSPLPSQLLDSELNNLPKLIRDLSTSAHSQSCILQASENGTGWILSPAYQCRFHSFTPPHLNPRRSLPTVWFTSNPILPLIRPPSLPVDGGSWNRETMTDPKGFPASKALEVSSKPKSSESELERGTEKEDVLPNVDPKPGTETVPEKGLRRCTRGSSSTPVRMLDTPC